MRQPPFILLVYRTRLRAGCYGDALPALASHNDHRELSPHTGEWYTHNSGRSLDNQRRMYPAALAARGEPVPVGPWIKERGTLADHVTRQGNATLSGNPAFSAKESRATLWRCRSQSCSPPAATSNL